MENPGKKTTGPGNLLDSSNKVFRIYTKKKYRPTVMRIDFEILGMKGFNPGKINLRP